MIISLTILAAILVYWRLGFSDETFGLDDLGDSEDWSTRIR
jgi:hypothetical protein